CLQISGAGFRIMSRAFMRIFHRVGVKTSLRLVLTYSFGQSPRDVLIIIRVAVRYRRHLDEFCAGEPQHVFLFLTLGIGNDDKSPIAAGIGDQRQPDAGIAGSAFDDHATRSDIAAFFRFENHLARRSILHRLARIHELGLAKDRAAGGLRYPMELDQGRIADRLNNTVLHLHGHGPGPLDPSVKPFIASREVIANSACGGTKWPSGSTTLGALAAIVPHFADCARCAISLLPARWTKDSR